MGGRACGLMGLAASRAWGSPQRWSSPRAGRRMGQVGLGMVPTSYPLLPPWRLPMPLASFLLHGLHTCPRPCWPSLLHPIPPDGSSGALLCVPAASPSSGTFLLPVLPPSQSYPSTAVPRTSEKQGTLVRGHLFQSADEEIEAQGGEAPCPRSHSELVSEPAQGPVFSYHPHSPSLPGLCSLPSLPLFHPAIPPLCPAPSSMALTPPLQCLCLLQGPPHRHLCAGPRAPSACGMRPWQVGSGGNSAPDSQWGEALSHSAPGTPPGSDSDSAVQVPWGHSVPKAKVRDKGPCLYWPQLPVDLPTPWGKGLPFCPPCLPTSAACLCPGPCGPAAALWPPRI